MGQVLKADGASADAYVEFNFAAANDLYVTFDLFLTDDELASVIGLSYGPDFLDLLDASGFSYYEEIATNPDGADPAFTTRAGVPFLAPLTGGVWRTIEVHFDTTGSPAATEVWVDGTSVYADTHIASAPEKLRLGAIFVQPDARQVYYFGNFKLGTSRGASDLFADDFEGDLSAWSATSGDVSLVDDPATPVVDPGAPRVYEEPLWRYVVTKLDLVILTFLDRVATQRALSFTLNAPAQASGSVPSEEPQVNISVAGHPYLDEGRRCLLGFRREEGRWKIRFAGLILQVEDSVDEAGNPIGRTNFTAYDPWQLMYYRPVLKEDGTFPGPDGVTFTATAANEIATALLDRSFAAHGETYIATGTIVPCDTVGSFTFQQGSSVGEAWRQLAEAGYLDIILRPIYDPSGHPGKLCEIDISPQAGKHRRKAIFSWDRASRSLAGISRLKDGTQRANRLQAYAGQGGPGVTVVSDFASVAEFGDYWGQEFVPGSRVDVVEALAEERLIIRKDGVTTISVKPLSEPSPRPFIDYALGDQCPVYASASLREPLSTTQRVYQIPIEVDDDGTERVTGLTFSLSGTGD